MIFGQIDQYIKIVIDKRNCKSALNVYMKKIREIVNYSVNEGLCIHHETFGNIAFFFLNQLIYMIVIFVQR